MERLGLWGDGTPFKSFETFLEGITRRGLGLFCLIFLLECTVAYIELCHCCYSMVVEFVYLERLWCFKIQWKLFC